MAPLMEPSTPVRLTSLSEHHIGRKIRVVGTIIGHDIATSMLLMADRELSTAIFVDASAVILFSNKLAWARGGKATLMVSGYLEPYDDELVVPPILSWAWEPRKILSTAVLNATLISDASTLDWVKWNAGIEEREKAGVGL